MPLNLTHVFCIFPGNASVHLNALRVMKIGQKTFSVVYESHGRIWASMREACVDMLLVLGPEDCSFQNPNSLYVSSSGLEIFHRLAAVKIMSCSYE